MDPHEVTLTVRDNGTVTADPQLPIRTPSGKELLLKINNLREIRLVVGNPTSDGSTPKLKITVLDENRVFDWVDADGNQTAGVNIDPPPPPVHIS